MKRFLASVLALFLLVALSPPAKAEDPGTACYDVCTSCKSRCSDDRCRNECQLNENAACCSAVGRTPFNNSCGCR